MPTAPEWLKPAPTIFADGAVVDAALRDFEAARRGTCKAKRAYLGMCGLERKGKQADLDARLAIWWEEAGPVLHDPRGVKMVASIFYLKHNPVNLERLHAILKHYGKEQGGYDAMYKLQAQTYKCEDPRTYFATRARVVGLRALRLKVLSFLPSVVKQREVNEERPESPPPAAAQQKGGGGHTAGGQASTNQAKQPKPPQPMTELTPEELAQAAAEAQAREAQEQLERAEAEARRVQEEKLARERMLAREKLLKEPGPLIRTAQQKDTLAQAMRRGVLGSTVRIFGSPGGDLDEAEDDDSTSSSTSSSGSGSSSISSSSISSSSISSSSISSSSISSSSISSSISSSSISSISSSSSSSSDSSSSSSSSSSSNSSSNKNNDDSVSAALLIDTVHAAVDVWSRELLRRLVSDARYSKASRAARALRGLTLAPDPAHAKRKLMENIQKEGAEHARSNFGSKVQRYGAPDATAAWKKRYKRVRQLGPTALAEQQGTLDQMSDELVRASVSTGEMKGRYAEAIWKGLDVFEAGGAGDQTDGKPLLTVRMDALQRLAQSQNNGRASIMKTLPSAAAVAPTSEEASAARLSFSHQAVDVIFNPISLTEVVRSDRFTPL